MRSKRRVLLHRKLCLQACEIAVDRGERKHLALIPVAQQTIAACDVAIDNDLVPFLGMADIVDRHVVVLAPEEGYRIEGLALAQHVARGGLSLTLGNHPMLNADIFARTRVGPARD